MDLTSLLRATRQWTPFLLRTMAYGTVSLVLGPMTPERSASLWAMRRWCQESLLGLDIRVDVVGAEHVPDGASVICANHQSLVDILVLGAVLPGDFKWAAKRELLKLPFLGWHLQLAGHVPVERGAGASVAERTRALFEAVLRRGKPLLIFPEGTRSEDGILRRFKSGAFVSAVRTGVPVVPVALDGTWRLMKKGAFDTGDGTERVVFVRIGAPLIAADIADEPGRVDELRDRTRAAVAKLLSVIPGAQRASFPPPGDLPPEPGLDTLPEN